MAGLIELNDTLWETLIREEKPLNNYPKYPFQLASNPNFPGEPLFEYSSTINQNLTAAPEEVTAAAPFGNSPAPLAKIIPGNSKPARNAYLLSALRQRPEASNAPSIIDTELNPTIDIPDDVKDLFEARHEKLAVQQKKVASLLSANDEKTFLEELTTLQNQQRLAYVEELVPLMNANAFDPSLHLQPLAQKVTLINQQDFELLQQTDLEGTGEVYIAIPEKSDFQATHHYYTSISPELCAEMTAYVKLQNSPLEYFKILEDIQKSVFTKIWIDQKAGVETSTKNALRSVVDELFTEHCDGNIQRFPFPRTGVDLNWINATGRAGLIGEDPEFIGEEHTELAHLLQYAVYVAKSANDKGAEKEHAMSPDAFFRERAKCVPAFRDALKERNDRREANPANANFWSVFGMYLPALNFMITEIDNGNNQCHDSEQYSMQPYLETRQEY